MAITEIALDRFRISIGNFLPFEWPYKLAFGARILAPLRKGCQRPEAPSGISVLLKNVFWYSRTRKRVGFRHPG
jgi:hypothetical protein